MTTDRLRPTPVTTGDALPAVLQRRILRPTTLALGAVAVLFVPLDALAVRVPFAVQVVPFAASVLLLGLPHGALDHLVPARLDPTISTRRSIATVVALYAVLGGATALLWWASPALGFAVFIAVTWFHWGQGDRWLESALRPGPASRLDGALTLLLRGALPMVVPLIAHPDDYASVFRMTVSAVDPTGATGLGPLQSLPARAGLTAGLLVLLGAQLAVRRRLRGPIRGPVVETLVLAAFFAAVPSVLAVGLYFTLWHSVRHILRLELLDPAGRAQLAAGRIGAPFARFLRDAWPVTLCAVALLVLLALLLRNAGLGTYLLLIAALSTPHTAVVTWMDRRQRGRG